MPTSTFTPGDERQEEKLNPGQQDYDRRFNSISSAEQKGTFDNSSADKSNQDTNSLSENQSAEELRNQEASSAPSSSWNNNTTGSQTGGWQNNVNSDYGAKKSKINLNWLKKRGPLIGIGGGVGISGLILSILFSGAALPISLMENITSTNDSSSTSMSRRALKTLQHAMTGDPIECTSVKIKCKMGRVSNSALNSLEKKGLKPVYNDGASVTNRGKKTGYPSRNPDGYEIEIKTGEKVTVPASELRSFLAENPRVAAKVLGTGGAFNLRLKAWSGKYINTNLNKLFGINKNGGIADGENVKTEKEGFGEKTLARLKERIPGASKLSEVAEGVKAKVEPHMNKAKKGGVGYTLAVASCIGVKAPSYIAAGVAAVQLAQILPLANEVILSPGSKIKAGEAVDVDGEAVGTVLTSQTARKSDGKMTSALDSQYLQAALGINKNKPAVSKDYTPGYSFLTNPLVTASVQADKKTASACNAIMSPAAMYTAIAVDSAVTVAASSTIIGGIVKVVASFAITEIASEVTKELVGAKAEEILVDMAQNDKIPTAEGEELGDVLGISAAAYFSSGGMARNLPTLKNSQISEYVALQKEDEAFQRDMDIASLSPFDTSSKYTFLGSIVNNLATTAIATGGYSSALGLLGTMAKMPLSLLSNNTYAATSSMQNYCGYADEFGLSLDGDEANTPAINMAGLPCTGITSSQAGMSTDTAITLISNEGWLDETKDIADNATIDDLMSNGYIKADTPLSDFIESCSNPETGDYLFNAGSCTVESSTKSTQDITNSFGGSCVDVSSEGNNSERVCASDSSDFADNAEGENGVKDPRSLEAISVFLLDFQIIQSINGEDIDTGESTTVATPGAVSTGRPDNTKDAGKGWSLNANVDYSSAACAPGITDDGVYTHPVEKFTFRKCIYQGSPVNSLVSQAVVSMIDAAKSQGVTLTIGNSFRSYEEQRAVYQRNCSGGSCSPPTATPGKSQHERGLAIDFSNCSSRTTACYKWLEQNAATYGYYNLPSEAWHWSTSGN